MTTMIRRLDGVVRILAVDDDTEILAAYGAALGKQESVGARELSDMRAQLFPSTSGDRRRPSAMTFLLDTASSAEEAVRRVSEARAIGAPYRVIFLDMRMPPGQNGVWAAERIRELDPLVELVICTAYSDIDPDQFALRAPPAEKIFYVQKPFHLHEIRQIAHTLGTKRLAEERITRLAYFDTLTGLPNRECFRRTTEAAITKAALHGTQVALLYVDLDNFKRINDALGPAIGDQLICEIAQRLGSAFRAYDLTGKTQLEQDRLGNIARIGGDEFLVLLEDVRDDDAAVALANRLRKKFAQPITLESCEVLVTSSIGIALYPRDGVDAATLHCNAELAKYYAKRAGRPGLKLYEPSMSENSQRRLTLEKLLHTAVQNGELSLRYQPQIDLRGGDQCGMEALLRWHSPEVGPVSPAEFIPVAEESGQVMWIGEWVLREACRQTVEWRRAGLELSRIAVNVSPMQFANPLFPNLVQEVLTQTGLPAECLELELTESAIMDDEVRACHMLARLKQIGVTISIDDFGTGFSNLSRLRQFKVDSLKIDRSYMAGVATNSDDAAIARAIIAMGKAMGLTVVAEGVEDFDQVAFLEALDCAIVQGFLFSKPLTVDDAAQFLARLPDATILRRVRKSADVAASS